MGGEAPQHAAEREFVEIVVIQIRNDHVGPGRADPLQRSHTVLSGDDLETATLQSALQTVTLRAVGLCDESTQMPPKRTGRVSLPGQVMESVPPGQLPGGRQPLTIADVMVRPPHSAVCIGVSADPNTGHRGRQPVTVPTPSCPEPIERRVS